MVREIKENELNQLLELYLHLHETSVPEESEHLIQTWQTIMQDENHHIIVKIAEDRIVSSCVCVIIPNLTRGVRPYAFVENVVTHKDYRGKGYAKECLNFAAEIARKMNCYKMMLLTGSKEEATLNFYKEAGYNCTDKTAFIRWLELEKFMSDIKELTLKDVELIKTFFKDVFMQEPWNDDWSDKIQLHCYIEDIIGNRNSLAYGLFEDDKLQGIALGNIKHWYTGTEFFVEEFCIKTEQQGRGLGTEFLSLLEERLKEKDIKTIFLMTGKEMPAFDFYRKNGFEEIINHVSLKKDI